MARLPLKRHAERTSSRCIIAKIDEEFKDNGHACHFLWPNANESMPYCLLSMGLGCRRQWLWAFDHVRVSDGMTLGYSKLWQRFR